MSKLQIEEVEDAVKAILEHSETKKRNFLETIELQIALKGYDPQRQTFQWIHPSTTHPS